MLALHLLQNDYQNLHYLSFQLKHELNCGQQSETNRCFKVPSELFELPQTCEDAAKIEVVREFRIVPLKKGTLIFYVLKQKSPASL